MTLKILWHSVAPWVGSGYGQQTATFAPRLRDRLGHDVAISAYYGLQGNRLRWPTGDGLPVYPAYQTGYGGDVIVTHALDHFQVKDRGMTFREATAAGLIITLCDVWVINGPLLEDMSIAAWCPIDHLQLPGITRRWFAKTGAMPIAMSRFGETALHDADIDCLYVPHGIDTAVFSPGDQAEARERTGLPGDAFIVAMVAANIGKDGSRKAFAEQIAAFAELRRHHKDALLVLHTDLENGQGVNLPRLLANLPDDSWIATDQYAYRRGIPADVVADIYRSADVLTNCSWGEGFGIPIVEAQACGTPVIVTRATAMPELCGAGWTVGWEPLWHESQEAWAVIPRIGEIAAMMEEAYNHAAKLRDQARDFALLYDADFVCDTYWADALRRLEAALDAKRADVAEAKAAPRADAKVVEADGLLWLDRGGDTEDCLGPSNHEAPLGPLMEELLPDGGVFVDIGAHVGHWSLRLARKASVVYAIEANPDAAKMLRRNIAANGIDNVEVIEFALWDEHTTLRLEDPSDHVAGGSTRTLPTEDPFDGVSAYPFDHIGIGERIDLIKIDVEGADLHVLRGMAETLERHRPIIFLETHDYCGYYTRSDLEALLTELGYTWRVAYRYQSRWSPEGELDEPVDADYLVCTPVKANTACADIARTACVEHGASQQIDELAEALHLITNRFGDRESTTIVELGCDLGGTLYAWRQVADVVFGITLPDNSYDTGGQGGALVTHGAVVHVGDSHDPDTLHWLNDELPGDGVDVLVLDGDHSVAGIYRDLAMYGRLVRPGGLILLHDIASVGDPRAEVHKVWPDLAARYTTREIRSPVRPFGWGIIEVGDDGFDPPLEEPGDDR